MQTVYVLSEKEKAASGAVILVLLLVGGAYWGFTSLFPSDAARLSAAKIAEMDLGADIREMERLLSSLEPIVAAPNQDTNLGSTGASLHTLKERLSNAEGACSTLDRHIAKLKKSSAVEMQLQAAGLDKDAATAREKLPPLAKRVAAVEQRLRHLVE